METLKEKLSHYPSDDTMQLFLQIGGKLDMLKFIPGITGRNRYMNINTVSVLSVLTDYLQKPNNDQVKKDFLQKMESASTSELYRDIVDIMKKVWYEKHHNPYVSETIEIWENKHKNKELSSDDLLWIPDSIAPEWYVDDGGGYGVLIHELFQERLAQEQNLSSEANNIQEETKKFNDGLGIEQNSDTAIKAEVEKDLKGRL